MFSTIIRRGWIPLALLLLSAGEVDWKEVPFSEDESALYFVGKGLDQASYAEARDLAMAQALMSLLLYKGVKLSAGLTIRRSEEAKSFLQKLEGKGESYLKEIVVVREDTEVQTVSRGVRRYSVWVQIRYPKKSSEEELSPEEKRLRMEYMQTLLAYREALEKEEDEGEILIQGIRSMIFSQLIGFPDEDLQREVLRRCRGITLMALPGSGVRVEGVSGPIRGFPVLFRRFSGSEEIVMTDHRGEAFPTTTPVVQAEITLDPLFPPDQLKEAGAVLISLFQSKRVHFPLSLPWSSLGLRVTIEGADPSSLRFWEDRMIQIATEIGIRISKDPLKTPLIDVTLHLLPVESFAGVYRARWEGSLRLVDEKQGVLLAIPFSGGDSAIGKDPQKALKERQRLLFDALSGEFRSLVEPFLVPR